MGYQNKTKNVSAAEVVWDPDGANIVLTPSMGGVTIEYSENTEPVKQDGYGDTALDMVSVGGENPKIVVPMASVSGTDDAVDRLQYVQSVTKSTDEYTLKTSNGESLRESAKLLYIKPLVNGVAAVDDATWTQVPVCTPPILKFSQTYAPTGQRVFNIEMYGLPDLSTGNVGNIIIWGKN